MNAYPENVATADLKVNLAARAAFRAATMPGFSFAPIAKGINTTDAYRAALDCDVIFSCVDRPWPRAILNHMAYSHLIPVIDGGIAVSRRKDGQLRSADWGAFVVGPPRQCLSCAGQFNSGLVAMEQSGDLDDPQYIEALPDDSPLKRNENVFAFSMALAAMEVLKLVQLVARPAGVLAPMSERYSFPSGGTILDTTSACHENCSYKGLTAKGEAAGNPGIMEWQ